MNRALPRIRNAAVMVAVATALAGCAGSNNATSSQASAPQGEQSYKTMYGLTSEGTTTDLYTELFGPRQPPPASAPVVAAAQPVTTQPITAQPVTPVQQAPTRQAQIATPPKRQIAAADRAAPPPVQPAPVQVAQQPPQPEEPDVPTAYGITQNGPTTDLYTMIFGRRDGK